MASYADSVRGSSYTNAAFTLERIIWRGAGRNIRKVMILETSESVPSVVPRPYQRPRFASDPSTFLLLCLMKPVLLFTVLSFSLTCGYAADWPCFRGPGGSGIALEGNPPTTWDESTNIAWRVPLPGAGTSSPIIWKDHVYLTSHTGYGVSSKDRGDMEKLKRHLLCYQLSNGELLWQKDISAKLPEFRYAKRMEWHGYASHTPAADADSVYCFFGKSRVHAFSHGGEPRWQTLVGDETHGWGSAASPVLVGDLVVVNAFVESGALVALDRKTGAEKWRYNGLKEAWDTPVAVTLPDGKVELALGVFDKVLGIDAASGKELWSSQGAKWYSVGSPITHNGVVYALSGKGFEAATAVRVGGRGEVTDSHRLWQVRKGSNVSSPLLHDGRLYFAHDQGSFFYCLDAKTGADVYTERLPRRFGTVYSSPVLAGGKIYLFSRQGGSVVIQPGGTFKILSQNPRLDESPANSSPAIAGDQLLIRSDKFLYCIGEKGN